MLLDFLLDVDGRAIFWICTSNEKQKIWTGCVCMLGRITSSTTS